MRLLLCSFLGSHFCPDLGGDVPNELECGPGTQDEDGGNQNTQDLQAHDGTCALNGGGAVVADPCQAVQSEALADGLADTADRLKVP